MAQAAAEKVAFWELDPDDVEQASVVPHPVEPCILSSGVTDIGIFPEDEDARVPVDRADFQPAIVKLLIQHQPSGTWTTATGWLSRDDLVVTAAYCVLRDNQHAACVRVFIGYSACSEGAVASPESQRSVTRIVLPSAWSDSRADQSNAAFLQLDRPFRGVTPIQYSTPGTKVQEPLTVVGYPSDMGARKGSPGGEMYHLKICREIDLETSRWNMLMYQGDAQGGLCGGPIIRDGDLVAIGVHVRGGSFNFGTVIGGAFGVNFHFYEEALRVLGQGNIRTLPSGLKRMLIRAG